MRRKQLRIILTFPATTDAMAMEAYSTSHQIPGRLIPLPPVISAGCGLCWSAPPEAKGLVEDAVQTAGLRTGGLYELTL